MSKVEQLIKKMCPSGVEFKKLLEVCKFQNGFSFKSSKFKQSGLPIIRIGNITTDCHITDKNLVYFNKNDYKENLEQFIVENNSIVIAMSGATTGKVGFNNTGKCYYLNQRVGMFRPSVLLNNRFLYHWLLTKTKKIYNISSGTGAQPNLSTEKMMNLKIPVPPLEIQQEIVRILDKFSKLEEELEEELKKRRVQYEHYRDKLLNFKEGGGRK